MSSEIKAASSTFLWRRVHSLMGLWLIIYLIEHLIVNSQATLWIGHDGAGFVRLVDFLKSLPYLQVIEITFIGIPLVIHGYWGVKRALSAKTNSSKSDGSFPALNYGRNRAFTWQRLTSWILLFGIIGHVIQMRFVDMPKKVNDGHEERYLTPISFDEGLVTLAPRIGATLYSSQQIADLKSEHDKKWGDALNSFRLKENEVLAITSKPGKAMLLVVRDTFKSPLMSILYTIFVLAASFHAFNGFWTSLMTWGALLSYRSQKAFIPICWFGAGTLAFLGLAAIWGSYWINLRN